MKLMLPALHPPEPDVHRREMSDHTLELLGAIDALLAEEEAAGENGRQSL